LVEHHPISVGNAHPLQAPQSPWQALTLDKSLAERKLKVDNGWPGIRKEHKKNKKNLMGGHQFQEFNFVEVPF